MASVLFSCLFGGLALRVYHDPAAPLFFPYNVTVAATGSPWLEGGGIAISSGGELLQPGAGLTPGSPTLGSGVDGALGGFRFLSIPYTGTGTALVANFTCYDAAGLASFSSHFPDGHAALARPAARVLGRSVRRGPGARVAPATQFPRFSASAGTALRSPGMGFVEWAGEMDEYGNTHGVGLNGYGGGRESGPLALFDRSSMRAGGGPVQAAVLGPGGGAGTHVAHEILGLVVDAPAPGGAPPVSPGCAFAPHTDEEGGDNAPGSGTGLLVARGNASACCAACAALGGACDSWVFATGDPAGDGHNCWPLLGVRGSKPGAADRVLGLARPVACEVQRDAWHGADAVGADGFEAGTPTPTPDACCVLCATLGGAACSAWAWDAGVCFPLLSPGAGAPAARPGGAFGLAVAPPVVLAAGVQGLIKALPPRFAATWWLAASELGLNDAVMRYGAALRSVAGLARTPRAEDPLRELVSYWSDNGENWGGVCVRARLKGVSGASRRLTPIPSSRAGAYYFDGV